MNITPILPPDKKRNREQREGVSPLRSQHHDEENISKQRAGNPRHNHFHTKCHNKPRHRLQTKIHSGTKKTENIFHSPLQKCEMVMFLSTKFKITLSKWMQKRSDNDSTEPKAQQEPQCPYRNKTFNVTRNDLVSSKRNCGLEKST